MTILGGVDDWYNWCSCSRHCGQDWSYEWLLQLRSYFHSRDQNDQAVTILLWSLQQQHHNQSRKQHVYRLPSSAGLHRVCFEFFVSTLQISKCRVTRILHFFQKSARWIHDNRGKWNRQTISWKNKVNYRMVDHWISQFPAEPSHYSSVPKKWLYFQDVYNLEDLWNRFKHENPHIKIGKTSFKIHFRLSWKQHRKFKRVSLDGCEDCLRLQIWKKNAQHAHNLPLLHAIEKAKQAHLGETDARYQCYSKDKHISIAPINNPDSTQNEQPQVIIEGPEQGYAVKKILKDRYDLDGKHWWLVEWEQTSAPQWVDKDMLENAQEALAEYRNNHPKQVIVKDLQKELETPLLRPVQATR